MSNLNDTHPGAQIDSRIAVSLLRLSGFLLIGISLVFVVLLISDFFLLLSLDDVTSRAIGKVRDRLFLFGICGLALAELVRYAARRNTLGGLFKKPLTTKLLISLLALLLPLFIAENVLYPFTLAHLQKKSTSLFVQDSDLGWRLRPGSEASWGGAQVKINDKGVRGPEVPYERDNNKTRILYLGDSVMFGYGLAGYQETFPYVVEALLEGRSGSEIETINAAVGGYSPWQQPIYLDREGIKYQPDLVILGFVLNDVTEKFELIRFGGKDLGHQLDLCYFSVGDWLRNNSALYSFIQQRKAKARFGEDVQQGAIAAELAGVEDLARSPESAKVGKAWSLTEKNLHGLTKLCRDQDLPLGIVIFPFTFQFDNPTELSAPQTRLRSWCDTNGVPCLKLCILQIDPAKLSH